MGNRLKRCKALIYALIAALILPMGVSSHEVYATTTGTETDAEDVITPSVIVSSYEELAQAIEEAKNGDVIGIDRIISICHDVDYLGAADKHITILKMANNAYFEVSQAARLTVRNITFDGNRDDYNITNTNSMFCINSNVVFQNVVIKNCYTKSYGGGLCINSGVVNINDCTFINNYASGQGGHIVLFNTAIVNARNTTFTKGESGQDGGAINICSQTATVNLIHSRMYGNTSNYIGGGISNTGKLFVQNSVIYGNVAECGADFVNKMYAKFQIESIEELIGIYKSANILPKEWITDFDYDSMMPPNLVDTSKEYALVKLDYEEIPEEKNPDGVESSGTGDSSDDKLQNVDKTDESNEENDGSGKDESIDDVIESEHPKDDSDKEDENKDDTAADNKENTDDINNENSTDNGNVSDNDNSGDSSSEQSKPEEGAAADSENDSIENNENKENQDKQENQGIVGNDKNNHTGSSSDLDNKDSGNSNNNTPDIPAGNANQTNAPSTEKPTIGNGGSESDSKPEVNKQPGSTINNGNQSDASDGGTGTSNNNIPNQPNNKPVVDNGSNIVNSNPSGDTNSGSGSNSNVGDTNINSGTNSSQSVENVLSKPENSKDSNSVPSDKQDANAITDNRQTATSDSSNDNSSKKTTVSKKKVIKKLTVTAKKGKKKLTGKTIKRATVKIKIGKRTYKVKANSKGKFTVKLKSKAKLKKGQKIKVTVSKKGYKTKNKVFKVK